MPQRNTNIVRVFKHGHLPQSYYYIDMELCDLNLDVYLYQQWTPQLCKDVPYFTNNLPQHKRMDQVLTILRHIASGVAFIHENDQIHRDLKPRNSEVQFVSR